MEQLSHINEGESKDELGVPGEDAGRAIRSESSAETASGFSAPIPHAPAHKEPRYKVGLTLANLFPTKAGRVCSYRCDNELPKGKWRWCSEACLKSALNEFWVRKGDVTHIRKQLAKRDGGKCAKCGEVVVFWEADHIKAVVNGGGGCDLSGYQTLCILCHKTKTRADLASASTSDPSR